MYNKKVLIDSLKNLGSAKAPVKRQDVMVDPSGNPMMKNGGLNEKPYKKVSVQKSNIQGKGLFADEPIRAGEIIGLSHIKSSFQKDGQTYLKSKETPVIGTYYNHSDDNFNAGSIIQGNKRYLRALKNIQPGEEIAGNYYEDNDPTLESPDDFKKGGSLPKMPRKKNSRGYSRSLEATNKFFTENSFFAKPKSRKNKVYDPNAKYYQLGGEADAMNAMMKARLAYANEFGNPAAQRMIVAPDQPYDFGDGNYGTHYMASMDNYAVPQIQNVNGQLVLGDFGPSSTEAMRFDNPDDAQYFAEHYKEVAPAFIEAELTPEEIEEYKKGGFIIEDISVPQLTKANLGKVVKTVTKAPASRTLITNPLEGMTILPIERSIVDLKKLPIDFDAKQLKLPFTINSDSGYLSVYPNNKIEDNVFHFATKMTNPLDAGRAMKLANDAFPQPNPSILEPYSLSLDSYNLLLNMANKKDWDMNFENHIPLNFIAEHSKLFDGIEGVPQGFRSVRQWNPKTAEEMISRLNADLQGRGLTEKAYLQLIPESNTGEIRIPNYKLTRRYNLGGVAKVVPPKLGLAVSSNLIKSLRGLGTVSKNLPALNYVADNYLKGLSNELNLPAAIPGVQFELPKLDLQQTKKLLEKVPMLESDFLTQYSGYNPIMYDGDQPIITGGLTGHKTSFENFDRSFRGSGLGNQEGGAYFTPHPDFAASAARSSSLGGYGLIPQSKTFTPYVSEALFKNPQNFLNYNAPMTNEFIKKVGLINGVDPRNFQNGYEYEQALRTSFNPTGNEDLIRTSQAQAADALRDKGFTGAFDPREITVFDESDVKKIKEQELYKDLDDALIMSYLSAASKNQEQQSDVEKKLVKSFEEYLTTGNKQKLIDAERKYGGALNQRRNGGPAPVQMDTPIEENDPSSNLIDANSYFSNWYGNRQLPFDEIGNKTYERTLKQFLPVYNPQSPLLDELNQSVPYEYTNIINNDPTVMGELVYDDEGDAAKILLNEKLKANPKELNSTIAHEERTRLWDKFGDKILPAEQIIIQPNLKSFEEGWGDLKGADKKQAREYYDYLTDPSQDNIQSLIFEVRQSKGLQPTQVITEDDIKSWKSEAEKSGALDMNSPSYDPALYNLFKVVKDEKGLKDLFNYIAKNDSEEEMQYAQQGGSIDYELGDEIDEATMQQLKKLGYTFEKI
jgi:hypothetical protein